MFFTLSCQSMELINSQDASPQSLAIERKEQLESIIRVIIDLPDPLEDSNWKAHDGEWRGAHGWMLETRASILGLLRTWPDYAPILKLRLANAVYHKAVFEQISKAHYENQFESNICAKTHPMLSLSESPNTDEDKALKLHHIYARRQAMLIAFIQLFEWLTQDDEKLVPATPAFANFKGRIRLPVYWIATVGPIKAQKFGMVLHANSTDSDPVLPVLQFSSNILPVPNITLASDLGNQVHENSSMKVGVLSDMRAMRDDKLYVPEAISAAKTLKAGSDPRKDISLDLYLVNAYIKTATPSPNKLSYSPTLDELAAHVGFYSLATGRAYKSQVNKPARMSALIDGLEQYGLIGRLGADELVGGIEERYGQKLKKSKRPENDPNATYMNLYTIVRLKLAEWASKRLIPDKESR
jgi:hypothetical protein